MIEHPCPLYIRSHPLLAEALNQDPLLLATINAVPIVGGSITQVLTWFGQEVVQERNKRLFQQLSENLEAVDEQAIKKDYFETEEGFDLLIKALDESRREPEAKRSVILLHEYLREQQPLLSIVTTLLKTTFTSSPI